MPTPTRSDVHVNRPLTNLSIAFIQDTARFVATRVFPNVSVSKKSDTYFTFPRGAFNKSRMRKRAPGTHAPIADYDLSSDQYSCDVFALARAIDDQIRDNADAPLNLDREATEFLTMQALIKREKDFVTSFFTDGDPGDIWTFAVDGVASSPTAEASFDPTAAGSNDVLQWNDASSNPLEDIAKGKEYVLQSTGFEPNKLVIGYPVWRVLKNHPDIVDRIKYSGGVGPQRPAKVTIEAVAALFEVDEILVAGGVENTADDGATATHSFIAGKHALLCYAAPAPGLMTPSAGYTFSWTGHLGAGAMGNRILRIRDDLAHSDIIEIEMAYGLKRVAEDLGYWFGSIVA